MDILTTHILYPITERIDHSSKCPIDMSEIRYCTCDHEVFWSHLSLIGLLRCTQGGGNIEHCIQECRRVCPSILTIRIATALSVVPDLMSKTEICECICDDHRCSATRCEQPDTTRWIEYAEFETSPCFRVEFFDIFFSVGFLRTKRMWKRQSCPVSSLSELLTIIDSSDHIEIYD